MSKNNTIGNSQTEANKAKLRWYLLSCGYMRKYLASKNVNPADIGHIVTKFLYQDWKFDHC